MRHGLYIGWLGEENLGDEAMFDACRLLLPSFAWRPVQDMMGPRRGLRTLLAGGPRAFREAGWRRVLDVVLHEADHRTGREVALLGGGTLINRNRGWLQAYRAVKARVARPVPVFGSGVANPEFWRNTPGWADTRAEWRAELADLPAIGVRGPLSARLLDEAGVANVRVVGDPALMLAENGPEGDLDRVVINTGSCGGQIWGTEEGMMTGLATLARKLRARGVEVAIVPIWPPDETACRELARSAGLSDDDVSPPARTAGDYRAAIGKAAVVVAVKLHAAVLAAAAGIPFISVEYRPKVRDFADSLGWGRFCVRADQADGAALERLVEEVRADWPARRAELAERVAVLRSSLRSYSGELEALLLRR
jgi:polysaccharide pyruvyl transferase WcaK-like protein